MLHELTHRLAQPHGVVADLDVAMEEHIGVRGADKLEHLYPEHGLRTLAILQHTQGLFVRQHRAATRGRQRSQGGLVVVRFKSRIKYCTLKIETRNRFQLM